MRDLLERRVPHYFAVYLGAGWGLIEFISFAEERYALSPAWTDLTLLAWALLIPSVLLFAYYHGRPGPDGWARNEKIGIPVNLAIALIVLIVAFSGRDLGATVRQITLLDEDGNTIERTVAKAEFRKRVGFFYFDVPAGDTASAWLASGVPSLLSTDLAQDMFIDMRIPMQFRAQLREAGLADGAAGPLSLQRRLAEEAHLPLFVGGSAQRRGDTYVIRAVLYNTQTGEAVSELTAEGPALMPLIDDLSVGLKQALELPRTSPGLVMDMPVSEMLSSSEEAVRAMLEGQFASATDRWPDAEAKMLRATQLDPTFALAHVGLYQVRTFMGRGQEGLASLNAAMQHLYRVPERVQMLVKVEHFVAQREMDKAMAVTAMMTEIYPSDTQGHLMRSQLQVFADDKAGAIASLRRVVELDPQQHELLLQIARLQADAGQTTDALATYQDYARRFPQDAAVQLRIAGIQQALGALPEARAALERAVTLEPTSVDAAVELALLMRNTGELDAAHQRLQAIRATARTAEDRVRVLSALQGYYNFRGQLNQAIAAGEQRLSALAEISPPVMVAAQRMGMLGLYVRAGQTARAQTILAQVEREMAGAIDEFYRIGQLDIAMARRDVAAIEQAKAGVRRIIDSFGFRFLESIVVNADAVIAEERGDWAAALATYTRLRELEPTRLDVMRDMARAHRNLNQLDQARTMIETHLRSIPWSPESNIEAARIRIRMGDPAGARPHLQRAAQGLAGADANHAVTTELRQLMAEVGL